MIAANKRHEALDTLYRANQVRGDTSMHTPRILVEKILDEFPTSLWSNPNATFLDPACGRGTFLIAIYERLFDGLVSVIPDTEKRKKHILKNQLWGVDINPMMIRLANATFTLYIKDTTNLICANSLEYDIGMKFDVVIGNPPYNDDTSSRKDSNRRTQGINLARKFCELAIDLSKHAIAILQPYNNKIYSDSLAMSYKAHGLYKIQDASNWFSVKQVIGAFYFNKQILVPEVSDEFQITPVLKDSLTQNLIIQAGKLYRKDYEHLLKSSGKYRVIVTTDIILYTDDINLIKRMEDRSFGKWRVVMGQNGSKTSLGKLILAEPADTLSYSVSCLAFNTEEEAKKCLAYLELESTKKLIATVKKGVGNNRRLFRFLPTLS